MNPDIDKVFAADETLSSLRKKIGREDYDLIIDIHKNFRSIFVSLLNGKRIRRYRKENLKKFLLVKFKLNLFREIVPVYRKYLLTIKEYLNDSDYKFLTSELNYEKERIIEDKYIVIAPGSRHFTKTYPAEKFVEYIKELNEKEKANGKELLTKVILVGDNSDNDKRICNFIQSQCGNVKNMSGNLSMPELANILFHSDYVVCNDSAILHFAETLNKKVIAVFGSTVREFGFFPQLNKSESIEIINLKCRPCTHIGRESCPKGHFKCMIEIDLGMTLQN